MPSLRLGLIAPEFPPGRGGMHELARGLATHLAADNDVAVYTVPGGGVPEAPFKQLPILSGDLTRDARRLSSAGVDAWLALNAGLIPLAPRLGKPFFAYCHGNDFLNPWLSCGHRWLERIRKPYAAAVRHPLRRRAIRRALTAVRHLLTNSDATAALLSERMGSREDRISVCPPGVDDRFFQERRAQPPGDRLRLLTVCRLNRSTARKNVDGVLLAISSLRSRAAIDYTVVGSGDDLTRLHGLATRLGIAEQVHFPGSVDQDQLLACYAAADLFILASKATTTDVEGFGIVYLEASASGVPVLCSRQGGATEAVREGVNGIVLASSAPESIAAGIERYLSDPARFPPARVRAFAEGFRWPIAGSRVLREIVTRL